MTRRVIVPVIALIFCAATFACFAPFAAAQASIEQANLALKRERDLNAQRIEEQLTAVRPLPLDAWSVASLQASGGGVRLAFFRIKDCSSLLLAWQSPAGASSRTFDISPGGPAQIINLSATDLGAAWASGETVMFRAVQSAADGRTTSYTGPSLFVRVP